MILDINNKEHLSLINKYQKCRGIILVNKYLSCLSPLNKMYVIDSIKDWNQVESEFPVDMMTARCDSLVGVNAKLPHGQTFARFRVRDYIREVKKTDSNAVIILEDMKPGTNERIYTKGGVNLSVKIGEYIYMEYVGPGFDARELCIGVATHESFSIPWSDVPFLKDNARYKYKIYEISSNDYLNTVKERVAFVINAYPLKKEEIIANIPLKYLGINKQIFEDVLNKIIFSLYLRTQELLKDGLDTYGVEINIVKDGTLVPMELVVPNRFRRVLNVRR